MKTKYTHGGSRPGAGRKPSTRPKVQVYVYAYADQIELLGDKEEASKVAINAIKRRAKNLLKKNSLKNLEIN